jgi:hypothetical protein
MKVGDLVKVKTIHSPKPWTEKVFLVLECNTNHIKLLGANNYGPGDVPSWLYRENWEVVSESR